MKHLIKRLQILVGLVSVGLLLVAPLAEAHVLKQDNGVSAVLHIAPFDAPVSNNPTRIEIEFSNAADTFSLNDYRIQLQLVENGQTVHDYTVRPAYSGAASQGLAVVTFPKADVYELSLSGTPTSTAATKFAMQYEVRVTAGQGSSKQGNQTEVLVIGAAALIIFSMFAARQIVAGKRYAAAKQGKNKEKKHV